MALQLSIPKSDMVVIAQKRRTESKAKFQRRYQCLWLLHEGYLRKDVANMLGVNIDTVTDWIKIYNKSGLEGLGLVHYEDRRPSSLDMYKDDILSYIANNGVSTINELRAMLAHSYGLKIEHSWLYRYCKKNFIALTRKHV
jgi:transposase